MIPGFENLSHYEILDISPGVEAKEIQEGYYRVREAFTKNSLASYSLFSSKEREEILKLIEEAYHTLIDKQSREEYDYVLAQDRARLIKEGKATQELLPLQIIEKEGEKEEPEKPEEELLEEFEPEILEEPPQQIPSQTDAGPDKAPAPAPEDSSLDKEEPITEVMEPPLKTGEPEAPLQEEVAPSQPTPPPSEENEEPIEEAAPGQEAFEDTVPDIPPPRQPINPLDFLEGGVTGRFFKRIREARGLSLHQVWEVTRIRRPIIQAIEEEEYEKLPADVFLKGMLLIYSRFLQIETPENIVKGYMERLIAAREWLE